MQEKPEEAAQSLLWLVWFRIKVKSLFLKHSCADITVSCTPRLLRLLRLISNHFLNLVKRFSGEDCQTGPKSVVPPSLCGICAPKHDIRMLMDVKAVSRAATSRHTASNSPRAVADDALPFVTVDLVPQLMLNASDEAQGLLPFTLSADVRATVRLSTCM